MACVNVSVYGNTLSALIDSGSSDSFISQTVAEQLSLKIHPVKQDISMALTSLKTYVIGHCFADIDLNQHVYTCTRLGVLKALCRDLKSAYHQVPIQEAYRKYTGFEAIGRLYQFCRIPFGVTNGVAVFHRAMDKVVDEEGLKDTFPYVDNIKIAGRNQQEHDEKGKKFHEAIQLRNLTLNETKSEVSKASINVLGYCVGDGVIKPDQERLRPLQDYPPPTNVDSLRRVCLLTMRSGYQTSLTRYSLL